MERITRRFRTAEQSQVTVTIDPSEDEAKAACRELFNAVTKEKWDKVLEIYTRHPAARRCSITRHRENTLHVMVMWAGGKAIRRLTQELQKLHPDEAKELLAVKDDDGDNALHAAAARGTTLLCKFMGEIAPELITASRNQKGETPLFNTYISGSTSTFLAFHNIAAAEPSGADQFIEACQRTDRTTILHLAIYREHFGLAFHIIDKCPQIINVEDAQGETPLVFLARKRHLFRSSYNFGLCQQFMYSVLEVTKLQLRENDKQRIFKGSSISKTYAKYCPWLRFFNKDQCEDGLEEESKSPWETRYHMMNDSKRAARAIFGIGTNVQKVLEMKEKHAHAKQIMELLIEQATDWKYDPTENEENLLGGPSISTTLNTHPNQSLKTLDENVQKCKFDLQPKKVSPFLVAAEVGITEIVEEILEKFPTASQDVDATGKNVVLVSVENRHPHIYIHLHKKCLPKDFSHVDKDGNSALHLAAQVGKSKQPWIIPGAALQMQWEIKWYEFVKNSFTSNYFFSLYNSENKTPGDIFIEEHNDMVKDGRTWLKDTATSCSVIVALIATVAFASAVTVPGGVKTDSGTPVLEQEVGFGIFAISSLMALCFSIISLIMFLSILTSRFKENAFKTILPLMLITGLTFQLLAISTSLVNFCAGHFFIINQRLKYVAIPIYAITCLSASLFAMANFNLYKDLIVSIITHVPERSYLVGFH